VQPRNLQSTKDFCITYFFNFLNRAAYTPRYVKADGSFADGEWPDNPNGAYHDIAGICNPEGTVLGLMPHPEAFNHYTNHPDWTRMREKNRRRGKTMGAEPTVGIRVFKNAVDYIRKS